MFPSRTAGRRRPAAAPVAAAVVLLSALGIGPSEPARALDGTPLELVFEATAGQSAYVLLGSDTYDDDAVEVVDVLVDWGDGSPVQTYTTVGARSHAYTAGGTYTVTVSPRLAADGGSDDGPWLTIFGIGRDQGSIRFVDGSGEDLLTSTEHARLVQVVSFGDLGITSLRNSFNRHLHLTDLPTSLPTSVTDIGWIFRYAEVTDPDLAAWDVSRVTRMDGAFAGAESFDLPIGSWDVGAVTTMHRMFDGAAAFNGDISTWRPTSATNMVSMFEDATSFDGDISGWKDSVSSVTDFSDFLKGATSFDQDLPDWDVSGADDLDSFFEDATSFNGSVAGWTFSSTVGIDVSNMFEGASAFDQPLSSWVTTSFDDINDIFKEASSFDQDISGWDVSNVTNFNDTFEDATSFDQDISAWDVSSGTNLTSMFNAASSFDRSLGDWVLNASADLSGMLDGSGMSSSCYDATLIGWAAQSPAVTGLSLGADGRSYSPDAAAARAVLVDDRSWTIDGDGTVDVATGRCAGGVTGGAAPAATSALALACLSTAPGPGVDIECTVSGGDPEIEILWRAGAPVPFATSGVRLGPDGTGAFTFSLPADVAGPVEVELVAWDVRTTVAVDGTAGTAGRPVPRIVPAGGGPADGMPVPGSGVWVLGALVVGGATALLRRAGRRAVGSTCGTAERR